MINSWALPETADERARYYLESDRCEIDNPDLHDRVTIHYKDRMDAVFRLVTGLVPDRNAVIADFGCAQGNLTLSLAELGYQMIAVEQDEAAVTYAKSKQQSGHIQWQVGNIETVEVPDESLDCAVLAEVIEHAAYPEKLVERALRCVRPGGVLVVSTPNGSRVRVPLPTLTDIQAMPSRPFSARQFGDDHLWKLQPHEAQLLVPVEHARLETLVFCGSTVLINRYSETLVRALPIRWIKAGVELLRSIPIINRKTFNTMAIAFRKTGRQVRT